MSDRSAARPLNGRRRLSPLTLTVTTLLILLGMWMGFTYWANRGDVRVRLVEVAGFTEDVRIWMPFSLTVELTNAGRRSTTIRRIDAEPDLEGYSEAYSLAAPYDLSPPLLLEPGVTRTHQIRVTLLNAAQLAERTYPVTFRIILDTTDGVVTAEFPAELEYSRDPTRRVLRRQP